MQEGQELNLTMYQFPFLVWVSWDFPSPEEATNFPPHLAFAKFGFTFLDNIFNEFFLKKTPRNLVDLSLDLDAGDPRLTPPRRNC